jgi:uncharacterized membrane protein
MTGQRAAAALASLFALGLWLRLGLSFDALPVRMASHFDGSGQPNGWQSKGSFAFTAVSLSVLFLALVWVIPALLRSSPDRYLNLPHKEYWLAPERRAQTHARIGSWSSWFACATLGFLAGTFELVIRANLAGTPLSGKMWLLLLAYLVFMLGSSVSMVLTFRRP